MTDQTPRPGSRAATRDRLIAAAAALIPEVGWENVSTRRVAERAGVNPGIVHYAVESIAALRRMAAIRGVREFFAGPASRAFSSVDPQDALARLLSELAQTDSRDPRLLLLYESLVAATRDAELRAEIAALLRAFRQQLQQWLAEDAGVTDPEAAAVTITAAIDGYLLQRALDPSLDPAPLAAGLVTVLGHHRGEATT